MLVTTHPQLSERVCIGYVLLLKSQLWLDIQVGTPPILNLIALPQIGVMMWMRDLPAWIAFN